MENNKVSSISGNASNAQEQTPIQETLDQRGQVYGSYPTGSLLRARLMGLCKDLYKQVYATSMEPVLRVYIYDIINKASRLATTPRHQDTWHDICGYARLISLVMQQGDSQNPTARPADLQALHEFVELFSNFLESTYLVNHTEDIGETDMINLTNLTLCIRTVVVSPWDYKLWEGLANFAYTIEHKIIKGDYDEE